MRARFAVRACLAACLALLACATIARAAAAAECPQLHILWPADDHHYRVVFSSAQRERASFALTIFSRSHAYALAIDDIAIERPSSAQDGRYYSVPLAFENPDSGALLGVTTDVTPELPAACTTSRGVIPDPSDAGFRKPPFTTTVPGNGSPVSIARPVARPDTVVPHCDEQFAEARVIKLARIPYPPDAASRGATGSVRVHVAIDENGHATDAAVIRSSDDDDLDHAALQGARNSTYKPSVFLCTPYPDIYEFRADFAKN